MASSFKVPVAPKLNPVPAVGVHIPVLFTAVKTSVNEKNPLKSPPAKVFGIPLLTCEVRLRPKKDEVVDYDNDPSTKSTIQALSRNCMFKMFNCRTGSLVPGGFYMFRGVTLSKFIAETGAVLYSYEVAQIVEIGRFNLQDLMQRVPFSVYSIRVPEDFYNPEVIEPEHADVDNSDYWVENHVLTMNLLPSSTLPENAQEAWFPGQALSTVYARFPDVDAMDFTYAPDSQQPDKVQESITGKNQNKLYLWVNQIDMQGVETKICVKTRIYCESIRMLQCQDWVTMGPLLAHHLCGHLIGSLNRQGLVKDFQYEAELFAGTVFAYLQLSADLQRTLHLASQPTSPHQCGWKVSANAAQRILAEYMKTAQKTLTGPPPPLALLKWANAANLVYFARPDLFDDTKFDYYVLSNYNFVNFREMKPLDKMTDDQLVAEFMDAKRYPRKMIMDVYVAVKPGCTLGIESVRTKRSASTTDSPSVAHNEAGGDFVQMMTNLVANDDPIEMAATATHIGKKTKRDAE